MKNWGDGSEDDCTCHTSVRAWVRISRNHRDNGWAWWPPTISGLRGRGQESLQKDDKLDCLQALPMDVYSHMHPDIQTHA